MKTDNKIVYFNMVSLLINSKENYRKNNAVIPKRKGKDGVAMAKKAIPNP